MTEIFTAKTVDEAKALAVKKFGKPASAIKFDVLEEGKKGFLGIGKTDASVRATYVEVKEKPQVKEKPVQKPKVVDKPKEEPIVKAEEVKEEVKEKIKPVIAEEKEIVEEVLSEESEESEAEDDDNYELVEDEAKISPKVKIALDYVKSILNAMDIDAKFTIYQNETGAIINIDSKNNGTIIGRRGETLDSIQYLCSIIANKGDSEYFRLTIDCLGYRSKRKETLEHLANKIAKSVLRTGRSQQLEPMNPYERRVIHSVISGIEGISSRSVGDEPYRKIIISSNNPKNNARRGHGSYRHDDRKGKGGDRKNNRKLYENYESYEAKAIDLSTSFEKDYKKPKPEDTIEGGLYGKIEI